ncbi:MAG: F0F1 ATP synthase subunit epsilon [wastewater metagenome]|nr:F0F1 ATP synthase subunit epsilon [Candidatus Loosdrechtia aerotolerans]
MRLKIVLPTEVLIDQEVTKVVAEAENGYFCLLPRHIDFVTALVPGILSFEPEQGMEEFLAVDEGILVKSGSEVFVSTRNAMRGPDLGSLKQTVEERFQALSDQEKKARSAIARMESSFIRRFLRFQ